MSLDGVEFGEIPVVFWLFFESAPGTISISPNSYIADANYGKYTIPEFENVVYDEHGLAVLNS